MKIISIINQKGGVGKTTSAVNIATFLGKEDRKVLLVDLDPQADSSYYSGVTDEIVSGSKEFLLEGEAVINRCNYFDVIATDISLADAEVMLFTEFSREFKLKNSLETLKEDYDYCIIDCPPSLSLLTINALVASHLSLSPVLLETFSIKGVNSLVATVDKIKQANKNLKFKLFVNKFDKRLKHNLNYLEEIKEHCGPFLLNTIIRTDTELSKSQTQSTNIFDFNKNSKASKDFYELTKEIVRL